MQCNMDQPVSICSSSGFLWVRMKNQAEGAEPRQGFSPKWTSQKSDCKGNLDGANMEPWRLEKQVNLYTQANPDSQGSDFKTTFITPPGCWPPFPSQLCLWLRATPLFSDPPLSYL